MIDTLKNLKQWLHHCIEVETAAEFCGKSQEIHQAAIDAIIADERNSITGNVAVTTRTLSSDEPFDFDSVHHLPLPREVESFPLVLEMVYQDGSPKKCFCRIKTDLNVYDGVTALHTGFNLIEYLETQQQISPYPFMTSNPPLPENQFQNFEAQLKRVQDAKQQNEEEAQKSSSNPEHSNNTTFRRTPSMGVDYEDVFKNRPGLRFKEVNLSFPEILQRIERAKEMLDIPFYAVTINYSPSTAVSLCANIDELRNRDVKIANICLPPVGTGPPAPMDEKHVEMLFNTIFLNSYGKHLAPHTPRSKIVGYTWDWSGFLATFPPFFHICQIQDKMFFSMSAPPPDFERMIQSGIFDDVGVSQPFEGRPFYKVPQAQVEA